MDEKNLGIILNAIAEQIKELKLEISLLKYENENLKKELGAQDGKN
jgi:cell shape-determining protein MreC